jgi:hypothetical protein
MRLGALEEAAGAIWSSVLGITYTLQLKIFITYYLFKNDFLFKHAKT